MLIYEGTKDNFLTSVEQDTIAVEIEMNENHKLSRMVATYDWSYNSKSSAKKRLLKYWEVIIGKWHKPWNYELEKELDKNTKKKNKSLSWAEQP